MRTLGGAFSLIVAAPTAYVSQASNNPVTRAPVRSELVQFEHSGYKPSRTKYPADIQAVETGLAAQECCDR